MGERFRAGIIYIYVCLYVCVAERWRYKVLGTVFKTGERRGYRESERKGGETRCKYFR